MIKQISTGFNYENKLTFFLEVPFFPNLHSAISSGCLFFRVPFFPVSFFLVPFFPVPFFPTPILHIPGIAFDIILSFSSMCASSKQND